MRRMGPRFLFTTALLAAVAFPGVEAQPLVLAPASPPVPAERLGPAPSTGEGRPAARAVHYARLDAAALDVAVAAAERGARAEITLEVAPGIAVRSVVRWVERRGPGRLTWSGDVVGDPRGHLLLTVEREAAVGRVVTGGRAYEVRYGGGRRQAVYEIAPDGGTSCGVSDSRGEPPGRPQGGAWGAGVGQRARVGRAAGGTTVASTDTVRVLIAYTARVREVHGAEGVAALVQASIDAANDVFFRSEVEGRVALGHAVEVPTPSVEEVDSVEGALNRLRWREDGVFDEVHSLRLEYRATLVSLLTELPGPCGWAFVPTEASVFSLFDLGFSVVRASCSNVTLNFVHEVGHNLGVRHDPYVDASTSPYAYGHGYVDLEAGFRTLMAYRDACRDAGTECPMLPYFSNPILSVEGKALGEPELSDAARALNESIPVASQSWVQPSAPDLQVTIPEDESQYFVPNPLVYLVSVSEPEHGSTALQSETAIRYRPPPDYYGPDSFTYVAANIGGETDVGRVDVDIEPVPDAPFASQLTAPPSGTLINMYVDEEPLEVRWEALRHPDYADGEGPLVATWRLSNAYGSTVVHEEVVGDTTRILVPLARLDEAASSFGIPPGQRVSFRHQVVVSDGERVTESADRLITVWRAARGGEGDEEEDEDEAEVIPRAVELRGPYPNPAREALTLELGAPAPMSARLTLYDVTGRPVLVERASLAAGANEIRLGVGRFPAGLYVYRVEAGTATFRGRVVVL